MRKQRVVGRMYGMKYSWKGHKDRNRHKSRMKRRGQARLVYIKDINRKIPTRKRWARQDLSQRRKRTEGTSCWWSALACVREGKGQRERYVDDLSLLVSEKEKDRGNVTLMICPCLCQRRKRTEGTLRWWSAPAGVREGKGQRERYVDDLPLLVSEEEKDRGNFTLMTCPCLCQRWKRTEGTLRWWSAPACVREGKGQRERYVNDLPLLLLEKEKDRGNVMLMICPCLC